MPLESPSQRLQAANLDSDMILPHDESDTDFLPRAPLDWRLNSLHGQIERTVPFSSLNAARNLDRGFRRLYAGSSSYVALLMKTPQLASSPFRVSDFSLNNNPHLGEPKAMSASAFLKDDPHGNMMLWVLAYQARRVFQEDRKIRLSSGETPSSRLLLAFARAVEADGQAFAATCVFETLRSEKPRIQPYEIDAAIQGTPIANSPLHGILNQLSALALVSRATLDNGAASTLAFSTYFNRQNEVALRMLDARNIAYLRNTPAASQNGDEKAVSLHNRFNSLKDMPYLKKDSVSGREHLEERPGYMQDITLSSLARLPHTGWRNRLRLIGQHFT